MKKKLFIAALAVVGLSSCGEKPKCLKITYEMYGVKVETYQYMTRTEAEATFSDFQNVQIFETKDAQTDCLLNNAK